MIAWWKRSLCTSSGKYLKTKHTDFYLFHKWWFFLIGSKIMRCFFTKLYIKLFTYPAYSFLLSSLIWFFFNWTKNTFLFAWACLFAWTMLYYMEIYHHSALFICFLLLQCLYSCMTMQSCHLFSLLNCFWLEIAKGWEMIFHILADQLWQIYLCWSLRCDEKLNPFQLALQNIFLDF